ncbi:hypothetical protein SEA_BOBBY_83 [Mycobacterium phage Bobby]|nr:hypothetical protein SEA_BOBBY_83 [Mycobacterium phage Bobby]
MDLSDIDGTALDTRLKHTVLTDMTLQDELSGEEFRDFINLLVWSVSLVSDGAFSSRAAMRIAHLPKESLERFCELGLVSDRGDHYRIGDRFWKWQSSRADLEQLARRRASARERQKEKRTREASGLQVVQ